MEESKYVDLGEFADFGYLQEVNRTFFHPLGMALEITPDIDGNNYTITGIWDKRDDPEGVYFSPDPDPDKAERVRLIGAEKAGTRLHHLGYVEQPVPEKES